MEKRTRRAERVPSDAEIAACEGDDETDVAQTGAEVRAACRTAWNFRIKGSAVESVMNAFTCTGPYAIMILYGIKQTENRNMLPEPREGRAAISCSKSFCKEQYGMFMAMAAHKLSDEDFEKLPSWREVKDWPGKIIAVCDYRARDGLNLVLEDGVYKSKPTPKQKWDEGYRFWWDLSNIVRLPDPIPCRGNVGMWKMPSELAAKVATEYELLNVRIETADDAYPHFRRAMPIVKDSEGFFVLPIDDRFRPIYDPILVSLGHIRGTTAVDLKEVFREAFKVGADAISVAHNHPSGDPTPSKTDLQITKALQSTARLLGIKFLDHLILGSADCEGGRGYVSVMESFLKD